MDLVVKKPLGSIFDITTVRASDKIICPNSSLVRYMMSYCFADEQKIHVIPNGVDLKAFDGIECFDGSLLSHYNIERENFLLYMGRLVSPKGVQYLIEAFKIVQRQHPNLKLVIVGRGNHEQQLRKIARNTNGVLFLGYVHSIRVKKLLYDASLSVVLPSAMDEVSPMVPLEGMASSKPVIASNVMGNSSMIKHGKNGFLTRPRDPESLAKYINVLCEDRALGKRMGMYGRKLVEKEFTLDKMINETLKTYESLRNEGITR